MNVVILHMYSHVNCVYYGLDVIIATNFYHKPSQTKLPTYSCIADILLLFYYSYSCIADILLLFYYSCSCIADILLLFYYSHSCIADILLLFYYSCIADILLLFYYSCIADILLILMHCRYSTTHTRALQIFY